MKLASWPTLASPLASDAINLNRFIKRIIRQHSSLEMNSQQC
jgi:hypothetical protein